MHLCDINYLKNLTKNVIKWLLFVAIYMKIPHHHPKFQIAESSLMVSAKSMATAALAMLEEGE